MITGEPSLPERLRAARDLLGQAADKLDELELRIIALEQMLLDLDAELRRRPEL